MDLKDKIKKNSSNDYGYAPVRQSGYDRNNFTTGSTRSRNPNRQPPRSVQYQPESFESEQQNAVLEQQFIQQPNNNFIPQEFPNTPQPIFQQQNSVPNNEFAMPMQNPQIIPQPNIDGISSDYDLNSLFDSKSDEPQNQQPINYVEEKNEEFPSENLAPTVSNEIDFEKIKSDFFEIFTSLFQRYDIDKLLIMENKIYTVNFVSETENEIFDEQIDELSISNFVSNFVPNGHYSTLLENGCKVEVLAQPIASNTTIVVSKISTDVVLDDEFITVLFEFLNKGKNVVVLSPIALETLFKITSDYFERNLCVTINEPIKTFNNVSFKECDENSTLKTVYSVSKKIEPDNVLIFSPNDLFSSINFMKKNNSVVLFSETDTPSDFVNSDVLNALGGSNEYNRVSILKSIDIIFTVTQTKNGSFKYTATQLLFPTNKSHVNKIKRIIGDSEIDNSKIYFYNLFEKEV